MACFCDRAQILMRCFKGRAWVFSAFFCVLLLPGVSFSAKLDTEQVKKSIVGLVERGTGFVIHREMVVTTAAALERGGPVGVIAWDGGRVYAGEVLWRSLEKDLALLRVPGLPAPALPLSDADPETGTLMYAFSFPDTQEFLDQEGTVPAIRAAEGRLGNVFREAWRPGGDVLEVLQHHADLPLTGKGGPLVNACGQVVGVNVMPVSAMRDRVTGRPADISSSDGIFAAAHVRALFPVLLEKRFAFEMVSEPCLRDQGAEKPYWLPLAALLLLGAGGLLYGGWKKAGSEKGRSEKNGGKSVPPADFGAESGDEPARKFQGQVPPVQERVRTHIYDVHSGGLRLCSRSGLPDIVLKGHGPFVLGRSPDCDVVLADKRISSRHLRIILKDGEVWLEDLDSMNGSFVDGRKLIPGAALRFLPGQRLQLTSQPDLAVFEIE